MHNRRPGAIPLLLAFALLPCVGAPIAAQNDAGFRLPVELFGGAAVGTPERIQPFQAEIAATPSWSLDPLRLGVKVSGNYRNPDWELRAGPRISSRVVSVLRNDIGLIAGLEATSDTDGRMRYAALSTFDVDGLLRMGLSGGWQHAHDGSWFFGLTLGIDPTRWSQCVIDDFTGECVTDGES